MCCAIGGGGPPFFKLTIFKLHLQKKCVSITLMHCISISPVYGYNVNVLPNAAHPVVDSVSKNFEVDYRNRPICTRVAGSIGDRSLVSPASTAIPQRGGPSSWAVAAFSPLCPQPRVFMCRFTCSFIPSSHVEAWVVFRLFSGTTENSQVLGQCVSSEKLLPSSSDEDNRANTSFLLPESDQENIIGP